MMRGLHLGSGIDLTSDAGILPMHNKNLTEPGRSTHPQNSPQFPNHKTVLESIAVKSCLLVKDNAFRKYTLNKSKNEGAASGALLAMHFFYGNDKNENLIKSTGYRIGNWRRV